LIPGDIVKLLNKKGG
jgi:hypothetical protein